MSGLQRAIDENRIQQLDRVYQPSNVGSMGIGGFGDVVPPFNRTTVGEGWEREVVAPGQDRSIPSTRGLVRGYRTRELEWRETQAHMLQRYVGEWVALEGERVIAHGSDPVQVVTQARAQGVHTPYVFFVESRRANVVKMGL